MREGRRVAVELLPVALGQQRLELPEHRRPWIRSQHLELREGRAEVGGVLDRRGDRAPVVLEKAEDIERGGDDPQSPAMIDDLALMRLWDRPPPRLLQRRRRPIRRRSSSRGSRPRGAYRAARCRAVQTGLASKVNRQRRGPNLSHSSRQRSRSSREERIAEDHVGRGADRTDARARSTMFRPTACDSSTRMRCGQ